MGSDSTGTPVRRTPKRVETMSVSVASMGAVSRDLNSVGAELTDQNALR